MSKEAACCSKAAWFKDSEGNVLTITQLD